MSLDKTVSSSRSTLRTRVTGATLTLLDPGLAMMRAKECLRQWCTPTRNKSVNHDLSMFV